MELYFYFPSVPAWHVGTTLCFYRISIMIKYKDGLSSSGVIFKSDQWIKTVPFVPYLLQGDEHMYVKL
jgi:hypothetical protein